MSLFHCPNGRLLLYLLLSPYPTSNIPLDALDIYQLNHAKQLMFNHIFTYMAEHERLNIIPK